MFFSRAKAEEFLKIAAINQLKAIFVYFELI